MNCRLTIITVLLVVNIFLCIFLLTLSNNTKESFNSYKKYIVNDGIKFSVDINNRILDLPENKKVINILNNLPRLTPDQVVKQAQLQRENGNHKLADRMERSVRREHFNSKWDVPEVPQGSILGIEEQPACSYTCWVFILVENCNDAAVALGKPEWSIVGACFISSVGSDIDEGLDKAKNYARKIENARMGLVVHNDDSDKSSTTIPTESTNDSSDYPKVDNKTTTYGYISTKNTKDKKHPRTGSIPITPLDCEKQCTGSKGNFWEHICVSKSLYPDGSVQPNNKYYKMFGGFENDKECCQTECIDHMNAKKCGDDKHGYVDHPPTGVCGISNCKAKCNSEGKLVAKCETIEGSNIIRDVENIYCKSGTAEYDMKCVNNMLFGISKNGEKIFINKKCTIVDGNMSWSDN